jgi:hypothetical protein
MIASKYPRLGPNADELEIYCDEGWMDIIDQTLKPINEIAAMFNAGITIDEIKEKYGQCRLYFTRSDNDVMLGQDFHQPIERLSDRLTEISEKTCESCGSKNAEVKKLRGNPYWVKAICYPCDQEQYEKVLEMNEKAKKEKENAGT